MIAREVDAAAARLRGRLAPTPLVPSEWLSTRLGREVLLKLENVQPTGSFKVRGAWNRMLALDGDQRTRGVVAASSGNHGLAVAHVANKLGVRAEVCVPETTPPAKRAAIAALGATVQVVGDDCVVTERHARAVAGRTGAVYLSPYNDLLVAAGQGTVAVELLAQRPDLAAVVVAVGGGGLVGGIGGWLHQHAPAVRVLGVSPEASPAMDECVRAGRVVDVPCGPTWSDSTAGGVEEGAVTFELCRDFVHEWLRVDEDAIGSALVDLLRHQHLLVEGAAALAVAGLLRAPALPDGPVAVVVCGANLPFDLLLRALDRHGRPAT